MRMSHRNHCTSSTSLFWFVYCLFPGLGDWSALPPGPSEVDEDHLSGAMADKSGANLFTGFRGIGADADIRIQLKTLFDARARRNRDDDEEDDEDDEEDGLSVSKRIDPQPRAVPTPSIPKQEPGAPYPRQGPKPFVMAASPAGAATTIARHAEEEVVEEGGACDNYRVDIIAATFGTCRCGFPKAAHQGGPVHPAIRIKPDVSPLVCVPTVPVAPLAAQAAQAAEAGACASEVLTARAEKDARTAEAAVSVEAAVDAAASVQAGAAETAAPAANVLPIARNLTALAATPVPPVETETPTWVYRLDPAQTAQYGPVTPLQCAQLYLNDQLLPGSLMWKEGRDSWQALSDIPELYATVQQAKVALPPPAPEPSVQVLSQLSEHAWFYLSEDGERQGPLHVSLLVDLCADGIIKLDTPVWSKLLGEWKALELVGGLSWMVQRAGPSEEAPIWFALDGDGTRLGPLTTSAMRPLLAAAILSAETAVWSQALGEWQRVSNVRALAAMRT